MMEQHSGLEVVPAEQGQNSPQFAHDSANAPERTSSGSPELKKRWLAPLTDLRISPESEYFPGTPGRIDLKPRTSHEAPESSCLYSPPPETYFSSDGETLKEQYDQMLDGGHPPSGSERSPSRWRPRRLWVIIGFVALILIAIAVGVGVGVGVTKHRSSSSAASSSAPILPHGIFNDSSVAIVTFGNGDKRLMYQENTGNIREALYVASTKQWTSDVNNIVATNAKNKTPLAALLVNSTGTPFAVNTGPVIFLFYITGNNILAGRQFISGAWTTRDNFSPTGSANATYNTAPDTRALAVTSIANSTVSGEAYVFYVAQDGSAVALNILPDVSGDGIVASPGPLLPKSLQGGHTLALAAGITGSRPQVGVLTSNGTAYYSLYFSFFGNNSWTEPELQAILVPPLPPSEQVAISTSLVLANAYPATQTQAVPTPTSTSAASQEALIGDVNIAQVFVNNPGSKSYTLFGFWVNGTDLAAYTTKNIGLSTQPQSPFPYSRLAGTTDASSANIYLYHQVNGTSIAEDTYNLDGGFFTTTYFEISTS